MGAVGGCICIWFENSAVVGLEFGLLRDCKECKDWLLRFVVSGGGNDRGGAVDVGEVTKILGLSPDSSISEGKDGTA